MTEAVKVRARAQAARRSERPAPTFNDMVVKACALALREFPRANGAYRDGRVELYSRVNVGVAVAAQDALVVPTVFDADRKSLGEIARGDARACAEGPRRHDHAAGALGRDVHRLEPRHVRRHQLLRRDQPAAGRAAGGRRARAEAGRPIARRGRVVVRDMMGVTLACDHRILYGADGARFLARVRELLEQPLSMALVASVTNTTADPDARSLKRRRIGGSIPDGSERALSF